MSLWKKSKKHNKMVKSGKYVAPRIYHTEKSTEDTTATKKIDKAEEVTTKISRVSYPKYSKIPCHEGHREVYERIFLCNFFEAYDMAIQAKPDILVPLESMRSVILSEWIGEIYYLPTDDFGTLSPEWEYKAINYLYSQYQSGKSIGIFCQGGHGRTGYIAALLLSKLGIEDPIAFVRENYCKETIESNKQIQAIITMSGNESLIKYKEKETDYTDIYTRYRHESYYSGAQSKLENYDSYDEYLSTKYSPQYPEKTSICNDCVDNMGGWCDYHQKTIKDPIHRCNDYESLNDYIQKYEEKERKEVEKLKRD